VTTDTFDPATLAALLPKLRRAIRGEVRADLAARALYASDASNYRVLPAAIAVPETPDELAATVALAAEHRVPLTMRGAGTSLAGNAMGPGLVVIAGRNLAGILELDPAARTVTALPGTVVDALNRAAAPHGLRVGPDPSTHSRCTVGGMVGNNACGSHSVRWGTTAENTLGLEVVTADGVRRRLGMLAATAPGAVDGQGDPMDKGIQALLAAQGERIRAELKPWPRRVSGYALDWLLPERGAHIARALVGTEGSCAVVSGVAMRLVAVPKVRGLLVLAFGDDIAAAAAVAALLPELPLTVESLTADLLAAGSGVGDAGDAIASRLGLPRAGAWLLVEAAGDTSAAMRDHARRLAAAAGTEPGRADALLVEAAGAMASLWRLREDGAGRSARLADGTPAWPGFEDGAVPPQRLAAYLGDLRALLRDHDLRGVTYGHFGEGCIHLRVGFGLDRPGGAERLAGFMTAAADLVVSHGGTLSGEHGDGRARGSLLDRQFSPGLIKAFGDFKAVWDPAGVLNPGIIVDPAPLDADLRRPRPTTLALAPALAHHDDNGDARAGLERCIGVGRCVSTEGVAALCPSYRATGEEQHSTRGRARLLQEMATGALAPVGWASGEIREALDLCLGCRACLSGCPTGVDMATWRAEFLDHHYRDHRLARPRMHYSLGRLPQWLRLVRRVPGGPRIANAVTAFAPTRALAAWLGGISRERGIPRLAPKTLVQIAGARRPTRNGTRGKVVLWPDTFTNHLDPAVGEAALSVLAAAGFDAVLPGGDVCCGLTWFTTGQLDGARAVLRRTLAADGLDGDEPVLVLEPSCAAMLRRDLPELLPDDPRARSVARRVVTLAELLERAGWTPPLMPDAVLQTSVVQPHCHQQSVLGFDADRRLLQALGISPAPELAGCCGLAGSFGAEAGHEAVSRAVAELGLLPALRAAGTASTVIADGFSCRTQVVHVDGRRPRHLAEVLAARLAEAGPPDPR